MNRVRSMTGYGKGEYNDGVRKISFEIKTVNNRYNDIVIKGPKSVRFMHDDINKAIKSKISRGRIDVYIEMEYIKDSAVEVSPNIDLAKQYKNAIDKIADACDIEEKISIDTLVKFQDVLALNENSISEEEVRSCGMTALDAALGKLIEMREKEGQELKKDILSGVASLEIYLEKVKDNASTLVENMKNALITRIEDMLGDKYELDENRLYNEIVFYSDKMDINEEITRLASHIKQIKETLEKGGSIGRKLDFIIQEANREVNTTGSKINDVDIKKYVIEMKNILEKIREQLQNIE